MKKSSFSAKVNLIAFSHFPSEFSGEGLTVNRSVCVCGGGGGWVGGQKVSDLSNTCETKAQTVTL